LKLKKFILGSISKIIFGILLIRLSISLIFVLVPAFGQVPWANHETLVFVICFVAYFLVHFLLYQPILSHVMAHELTHALAAILMGGKVTSIHASTTGGTTIVNKSHVFISLAPYVFPFYTAVTLGLYLIAAPGLKIFFLGLMGFTYAFHLALTIYSLSHHQPDLKEGGVVFSLIFIFAGNMIVLTLLVSLVWPQVLPLSQAFTQTLKWAWHFAQALFYWLSPHLSRPEGHTP
jgi:hypothetical protein